MAKFCGKCGSQLDDTGKCPSCTTETKKEFQTTRINTQQNLKKNDASNGNPKNIGFKVFIAVIILIFITLGTVGYLVYNEKIDISLINSFFTTSSVDNKQPTTSVSEENSVTENDATAETTTQEEVDLSTNYEVPDFDIEEYFQTSASLMESFDAVTSDNIKTEEEAYNEFYDRGFEDVVITYDYTIDGDYLGETEISYYSSDQHPIYQAYYITKNGDMWIISQINGSFFATPVSYNFSEEDKVPKIISETDTITTYDSTTNKFYINIPNDTKTTIKTVKKINAKTIEKLTSKELDK